MTESIQTDAFILRTVEYGESHVIATLLGRDLGKFAAIARGAQKSRKRFGGCLLPLRSVAVTVTFKPNRDLAELAEATVQHDYPGIELSYDKITIASYCTELVRAALRDHDEASAAFDLLESTYTHLGQCEDSADVLRAVLHHFELALLSVSGGAPMLHMCHRCGAPAETMDRFRCGRDGHGLVCADCVRPGERYGVLAPTTVEVLRYLEMPQGRPPDGIADVSVAGQVRRVIDASLEQLVDGEMRSRALLDQVFAPSPLEGTV